LCLWVAVVHGALGDDDRAFEWLARAYEQREPMLLGIGLEGYIRFPTLRGQARFVELMRKLGVERHDLPRQRAAMREILQS
jgi:hypothetical protein